MAKQKKLSVPRELDAIQKEYQNTCFNAGQVQYQISVYKHELEMINERLLAINNEAAARRQLDEQKAKDKEPAQAVANG